MLGLNFRKVIEVLSVLNIEPVIPFPLGVTSSKAMDSFRDRLAKRMWADYQRYLSDRDI